jgi:ABC-type Fe3+ transport system permease subunit
MNDTCSHCGTRYKIEPSFFYGAMYVSYAVGVAFGVAAFIIFYFFFKTELKTAFIGICATLLGFMPIIMRLSRNIWINFFISYNKDWKNEIKK